MVAEMEKAPRLLRADPIVRTKGVKKGRVLAPLAWSFALLPKLKEAK
jgi:hypothetical protein